LFGILGEAFYRLGGLPVAWLKHHCICSCRCRAEVLASIFRSCKRPTNPVDGQTSCRW